MAKTPESLIEELTRGFRWVIVACGVFAVGIVYTEWRSDERLRYRAPNTVAATLNEDTAADELAFASGRRKAVYVPAYLRVYHKNRKPLLLTVTLSVRNTDRNHEIVLTSVRYHDSRGQEVRSHLERPIRLKPLSTVEFLVDHDDTSGGSGASFIVEWAAEQAVTAPLIETIMIDTERSQGISFARRGLVVAPAQDKAQAN